jgi:hypothetical protein
MIELKAVLFDDLALKVKEGDEIAVYVVDGDVRDSLDLEGGCRT